MRINDPYVEALVYAVAGEGSTKYENPEPLEIEHQLGHFVVKENKLRI